MPQRIPSINFFSEGVHFTLKNKTSIRNWLLYTAKSEKKTIESINFIFCSDKFLLKLNKTYLEHNYYSDVLTFDYDENGKVLIGEIYISIDRVKENAKLYSKSFYSELHRVMIHGMLHLAGYEDNTSKTRKLLTSKEDKYLTLLHQ